MTNNSFNDLDLIPELHKALIKQNYTVPTPIQFVAIPHILRGRDLIGIAQTGTGKTAAFTLPILQRMKESYPRKIKTLVLAPTRELAAQIGESFATYGAFLKFKHTVIFGGVGQGNQVQALEKGVDIVIATPGRLLDLLDQKKLSLMNIEFFVLDEADRMLDMGFIHDIKRIIAKLPQNKQSLFFSATMSPDINKLASSFLKDPAHVAVTPEATTVERIDQCLFFVDQTSKDELLLDLLQEEHLTSVLIFTRTKHKANKVALFLNKHRIDADAIHGNKSQNARIKAMADFKSGKCKVLVATDIAARGIDIDNISHVINYELPNEPESYVHRIGRTARAGAEGTAFSFCAADERNFLRDIEKLIKQKIKVIDHKFHSDGAMNATGLAAKPAPRKPFFRGAPRQGTTHQRQGSPRPRQNFRR
jgi:ATP-dependent RNA helicase RhlE